MPRTCSSLRALNRPTWIKGHGGIRSILIRSITTPADASVQFVQQIQEMKKRRLLVEEGFWDISNIKELRKTLQSHLSLPGFPIPNLVPPGYHQVSFNSLPYEHELSHDGAEKRHEPNYEWKFRVWAGGYLGFSKPLVWTRPKLVAVNERITDARLIGDLAHENAKVMVTLTRTLFTPLLDNEGLPVRAGNERLRIAKTRDNILIKEEKYLCFMREVPPNLTSTSPPRILAPPGDPTFSQTMTPSPTLLFRFSALTRNAHAIHLDADYTRQVYGLPKLLVHGPLTSVLMLDVLGEALALHSVGEGYQYVVRTFEYRNLLPLFVNEQITISCKRLHNIQPQDKKFKTTSGLNWEKWDVWIQKGANKDTTLAVRGTAWVSPLGSMESQESLADESDPSNEELENTVMNENTTASAANAQNLKRDS